MYFTKRVTTVFNVMFCTKHEHSLIQLDSCLVQNMTLNIDYSAVDASFKKSYFSVLYKVIMEDKSLHTFFHVYKKTSLHL